jgi:hypothetical protein
VETHCVVKVEYFLEEVTLLGHCGDFDLFALEKFLMLLSAVNCFEYLQLRAGFLEIAVYFFHYFVLNLIHFDLLSF